MPTGAATVTTADTTCIAVDGNGSGGSPITATPVLNAAAGNLITCTPTGLRAALTLATCGLTGNGSAAAPLAANVGTWAYPCAVDTFAGNVYCDSTGKLRSEPRATFNAQQNSANTTVAATAVPAAIDTTVDTRTLVVTNPDTCRTAYVLCYQELDVDLVLPANAGGAYGFGTDEMVFHSNRGGTTETDFHVQVAKMGQFVGPLAPGASQNLVLTVAMGRGAGGAQYNRIQHFNRAFLFIL